MDHSTVIYLMGPEGKYVTHFGASTTPAEMAKRLNLILEHNGKPS